ncbi:hypothetical protein BH20ACI3_BH20ACI3_04730 [soil metagenome]
MKRQIAAIVILALVGGLTLFLVTRNQVVATIPAQAELIVIPPFKSGVEGVEIVSADVVYDPVPLHRSNWRFRTTQLDLWLVCM